MHFFVFFCFLVRAAASEGCSPASAAALLQRRQARSALENVTSPVTPTRSRSFLSGAGFEGCPARAPRHVVALAGAKTNSSRVTGQTCSPGEVLLLDFSGGIVTETCCKGEGCSGCARFSRRNCEKCLGGYTMIAGKCVACLNLEGFADPLLRTCSDYESNGWCQGGAAHSSWAAATNSTAAMHDFRYQGISPVEACCACGGGTRAATAFKYPASSKTLLVGQAVEELPEPRTATEYSAACDLHTLGLSFEATSGRVSGLVAEPQQLECIVTSNEGAGLEFNSTLSLDFAYFSYGLRALDFADPAPKPVSTSLSYLSWSVACTPSAPWLHIGADGALYRDGDSVPWAASCLVTAVLNSTVKHTLKVTVFRPFEWGSMRFSHDADTAESVQQIELTVGGAAPKVAARNYDATPNPKAVPPVKFVADCGSGSSFNDLTGDVLLHGERVFTLTAGRISGSPSPQLFRDCPNQARCSKQLNCSIYGLLGFSGARLETWLAVNAYDDLCWAKVESGHFEMHQTGPAVSSCREWCRATPSCAAYSIETGECQGMRYNADAAGPKTYVKILGCSRFNSCLHVKVTGEDWLSGAYCPTSAQDGGLPYYTKQGVAGNYDSIHLQHWESSREIWSPAACPAGTQWVLRRAQPTDFQSVETGGVELRGQVLGCLDSDISTLTFDEEKGSSLTRASGQVPIVASSMAVSSVPAARDCASPFEEESKSEVKENEKLEEEGEKAEEVDKSKIFAFDDLNTPLVNDYFLDPCECFNENWAGSTFVHEDTWNAMPAGSNNKFRPPSVDILTGGASCEPQHLLSTSSTVDDKDGCLLACQESSGCNYFWHGDYSGVKVCRLYSACNALFREVNSNGQLSALTPSEACLIADPDRCWAEEKRRKFLANQAASSACLFEALFTACDELLLLGGHGIESCSRCTMNPVSSWTAKKPMPMTFMAGTALGVSCAAGFRGAELGNSLPKQSEILMCVDGEWLDSKGRRSLTHFQCQSCIQASKVGLKTFIHSNKQEIWFYDKIGKEIRSGAMQGTECLLPTTLETPAFNKEVSFQDWWTPTPSSVRSVYRDVGLSFGAKGDLSYGWKSQSGSGCSFPAGNPAAFAASIASKIAVTPGSGWTEITGYSTAHISLFNAGGHLQKDTGRFIAPVNGYYHFDANMRVDGLSGLSYGYLAIGLNGATTFYASSLQGTPTAEYLTLSCAGTTYMYAGQYASVYLQAPAGGGVSTVYVLVESTFSGHLISGVPTPAFQGRKVDDTRVDQSPSQHASGTVRNYHNYLKGLWSGTAVKMEGFSVTKAASAHYTSTGWQEVSGWTSPHPPMFVTSNSFDPSTGRYTAPSSGMYQVSCTLRFDVALGLYVRVVIGVNGAKNLNGGLHTIQGDPTKQYYSLTASGTIELTAGQYISCFALSQSDDDWWVHKESGFSVAFLGDQVTAVLASKVSGSRVQKDPVAGYVGDIGSTLVSSTGWYKCINWAQKYTLLNAYLDLPAGIFTAPSAGVYHVSYLQRLDSASGQFFRIQVAVDGSTDDNAGLHSILGNPPSTYYSLVVAGDVWLNAGQTLSAHTFSYNDDLWRAQSESGFSVHKTRTTVGFLADKTTHDTLSSGWNNARGWRTSGATGLFNLGGNFDPTEGEFTANAAGYYFFSANLRLDGMTAAYYRLVVQRNDLASGTTLINNQLHSIQGSPASNYQTLNVAGLMNMNAGDTARIKVASSSGADFTLQTESGFSGHKIDTDVAFAAARLPGTSLEAGVGWTQVSGWSTSGGSLIDHAGFDGTSFTAPVTGLYHVACNLRLDGVSAGYMRLSIGKTAATSNRNGLHNIRDNPPSSYYTMNVDGNIYLVAGETVSVYVYSHVDTSYWIQAESGFSGFFVGGIHEGEGSLNEAIPGWRTSGNIGLVDSGNNFDESTGEFTAPSTGNYHVAANVRMDGNGGQYSRMNVAINGNVDLQNGLQSIIENPVNSYYTHSLSGNVYLAAGEKLSLVTYSFDDLDYYQQSESGFSVYYIGSGITGFSADLSDHQSVTGAERLQGWRVSGSKGLFSSGHFSTTTGEFTVPVAGYYLFSANVRFDAAAEYVRLIIAVDDVVDQNDGSHAISGSPMAAFFSLSLETTRYLDKGQKVSVWASVYGAGNSVLVHSESGFSGHLIQQRDVAGFDEKLGDFKAPTDGYYLVDASLRLDGAAGSYSRGLMVLNDDVNARWGMHTIMGNPVSNYYTHNVFGLLHMNAGDTVHVGFVSVQDNDIVVEHNTAFTGIFLGDSILGFQADLGSTQTVSSTGWTEITGWRTTGNAAVYETGDVLGTSRFRPNRAGYYHFAAMVRIDGGGGRYMRAVIARNSDLALLVHNIKGSPETSYFSFSLSGNMYLGESDYASVWIYSREDSTYSIQGESSFLGYEIKTPEEAISTAAVADPQDLCQNTRWEMQVPNGFYTVTLNYGGSPLEGFDTQGCALEGYNASVGTVVAGQMVSKALSVSVVDGALTLQGEKASGCSGINSIIVEVANMVRWGSCGLGGWKMTEKDSAYQMEFITSSGGGGFCLGASGAISACGNDRSQMHLLDHFPVLVSQWTHWISDQVFQGTCAKGQGSDVRQLTSHGTAACGMGSAFRSLDFVAKAGCGATNTHQYQWRCSAFIQTPSTQCIQKQTPCADISGDLSNWRLDKFRLECPELTALQSFKFESCGGSSYRYSYSCCSVPGMGGCEVQETDWAEGAGGTLEHLEEHHISCKQGEALRGFVLDSKVPVSNPGRGEIRYMYVCCTVPMALPVSIAKEAPLANVYEGWEGGYCPHGSIEGRLSFMEAAAFDAQAGSGTLLSYDMHAGKWCVGGVCVSHSVAHPIELPKDPLAAFEVSPRKAFNGEFEGKGVKDYEAPVSEEEQGGGDGSMLPDPSKKKQRATFQASDFSLDTNFVSSVSFTPWRPSDCENVQALPTEGEGNPTDRCYLAFCKARSAGGLENYDGTRGPVADAITNGVGLLGQEAVPEEHPCYHAFNDQTNKRQLGGSIWDITNPSNAFSQAGLNSESVYWCSSRDIERTRQMGVREAQYEIVDGVADFGTSVADLACDAAPEGMVIFAPMGFGAGLSWDTEELCDDITAAVASIASFVNHMEFADKTFKFAASDAADCNPLQEGLQKIYCDLYCIEDAVKKGDKSILDTIGNLYQKIKLTTKEMFDFYIGQVLGKMGVFEGSMFGRFDAISDEIMALDVKVGDQVNVRTGDLDSQLKEIISKLEKDLDVGTGTMDAKVDAIAQQLGVVQLADQMQSVHGHLGSLVEDLHKQVRAGRLDPNALQELQNLETMARQEVAGLRGNATKERLRGATESMLRGLRGAQKRTGWERAGKSIPARAAERTEDGLKIMEDVLKASQQHLKMIRSKVQKAQVQQEDLRSSGDVSVRELERTMREMHLEAMLVEFDRQWSGLSKAVTDFLEEADAHHAIVDNSVKSIRSYTQCGASRDYPQLLEEYKQLQRTKAKLEDALRVSFSEMEQRLTLLADVLVDGGMLKPMPLPSHALHRLRGLVNATEGNEFFQPHVTKMLRKEVERHLAHSLPKQLSHQTKVAFQLAEHLAARHLSAGLQPREEQVKAMRMAWHAVLRAESDAHEQLMVSILDELMPRAPKGCDGLLWKVQGGQLLVLPVGITKELVKGADAAAAAAGHVCERRWSLWGERWQRKSQGFSKAARFAALVSW